MFRRGRRADVRLASICGIRARVDVAVYPSIPSPGIGANAAALPAEQRFAHVEALAARGLLEFAVPDPGSVNATELAVGVDTPPAGTYLNPESDLRHGLALAVRHGLHPAYAIYEPGFARVAPRWRARPAQRRPSTG
jgi:3-keto-5-aminohexanoate cleavage enzyme